MPRGGGRVQGVKERRSSGAAAGRGAAGGHGAGRGCRAGRGPGEPRRGGAPANFSGDRGNRHGEQCGPGPKEGLFFEGVKKAYWQGVDKTFLDITLNFLISKIGNSNLTLKENYQIISRKLGIHDATIRQWLHRGRIPDKSLLRIYHVFGF